jgi:hypothetical protein
MAVWELVAVSNDLTQFVATNREDVNSQVFHTNGKPKTWLTRPQLTVFIEKRRKKPKPLGDVSFILPGSVILNQKAHAALHDFLGRFGQFLETECDGKIFYFYNVTTLLSCVDPTKSRYIGPALFKAAFDAGRAPQDAQVFKDPLMLETAIFVSEAAKAVLDGLIAGAHLTGIRFEPEYKAA